jgi:hypothetical protein
VTLPNLVIAGVGKAGTTSLFWYLSQHPDICASDEKEIRYFAGLTEGGTELPPVETYERHFRHCRGERYAMEASPQYFHGGAPVIQAMRRLLGRPRVVISLRDPVERLWSQFRFTKSRLGPVPETLSFEAYQAQVVAFLDPDVLELYDRPEAWERLRAHVLQKLTTYEHRSRLR